MQSRLLTIREQWILLGVAGAIVMGAGVLLWLGGAEARPVDVIEVAHNVDTTPQFEPGIPESNPTDAVVPDTLPGPVPVENIGVGVLGAVRDEGLYFFEAGARVQDLLDAAGGVLPDSDLSDINRTAHLIDETTLLVPEYVEVDGQTYSYPNPTYNPTPYTRSAWYRFDQPTAGGIASGSGTVAGTTPTAPAAVAGGPVNINTASQAQLETLPGIGPATAQKIIAYRNAQRFNTIADLENVSGIGPAKMAAVQGLITVN